MILSCLHVTASLCLQPSLQPMYRCLHMLLPLPTLPYELHPPANQPTYWDRRYNQPPAAADVQLYEETSLLRLLLYNVLGRHYNNTTLSQQQHNYSSSIIITIIIFIIIIIIISSGARERLCVSSASFSLTEISDLLAGHVLSI